MLDEGYCVTFAVNYPLFIFFSFFVKRQAEFKETLKNITVNHCDVQSSDSK